MTGNFAPRKSWKQPVARNIAPRKWAWLALRASNMHTGMRDMPERRVRGIYRQTPKQQSRPSNRR
jgi:hypothetical protein